MSKERVTDKKIVNFLGSDSELSVQIEAIAQSTVLRHKKGGNWWARQLAREKISEIIDNFRNLKFDNIDFPPTPSKFVTANYFIHNYGLNRSSSLISFLFADVVKEIGVSEFKRPIVKYILKESLPIIEWYKGLSKVDKETERFIDEKDSGWMSVDTFAKIYSIGSSSVFRALEGQRIGSLLGIGKNGHFSLLYQEQHLQTVASRLLSVPKVDTSTNLYLDENNVAKSYPRILLSSFPQLSENVIYSIISRNLTGIPGRDATGHITTLYPIKEATQLLEEFVSLPQVDKDSGIYFDQESNRVFLTVAKLEEKYGLAEGTINKYTKNIPSITGRDRVNHITKLYDEEAFLEKVANFLALPQITEDSEIYIDADIGRGWIYRKALLRIHPIGKTVLNSLLKNVHSRACRISSGQEVVLYDIVEAEERIKSYLSLPQADRQAGTVNIDGKDWVDNKYLRVHYAIGKAKLKQILKVLPKISARNKKNIPANFYDLEAAKQVIEDTGYLSRIQREPISPDEANKRFLRFLEEEE